MKLKVRQILFFIIAFYAFCSKAITQRTKYIKMESQTLES